MKKLSIIIPYYKTLEYTKKLFETLTPQLNDNVEVILIDDGCNEKELDNLKAKVIHLDKPSGNASKPRNIGLDNATGEYIVFIDSDDNISDDYIETILNKTKEEWDYCFISWDYSKGKVIIENEPPIWNTCVWNCVYKKKLIENSRFDLNKNIGEDEDFNKRVRKGIKANITKILYHYTIGRNDSLTNLFSKGAIDRENIKCGLLVYQKFISKIGGIETFLYNFFKLLHEHYDILFVYKDADKEQLRRYKHYVKCIKYAGQKFTCDKYLCVSNQDNIADNVNSLSGEYLDMIHADFTAMNWKYKSHPKTTKHIAVSNIAKKSIEMQDNKPCVVIYNVLDLEEPRKPLMIMSAQRVSVEKGENEMKLFASRLSERNIPFIWINFTDNKVGEEQGILYKKCVLNIQDYFSAFDYFASFSRTESYGYSLVQAMSYGLPLIVRDIPVLDELNFKDNINGYKINYDMSNIDEVIDKLSNKPKFKYDKLDNFKDWIKELGKLNKYNEYEEEKEMKTKVEVLIDNFTYGKYWEIKPTLVRANPNRAKDNYLYKGDTFICDESEAKYLSGENANNIVAVKILETIKEEPLDNKKIEKEPKKNQKGKKK